MRICVFSTATDDYAPHAVVSLLSFKKHNPQYDAFLLCTRLGTETRSLCRRCGIEVIEVDLQEAFYKEWKYPRECYYHFAAPELFSAQGYAYSVYIDGDTYCNGTVNVDDTSDFHVAGVSYDSVKDLFTEIGDYESVSSAFELEEASFSRDRIQTGFIIYNNKLLEGVGYFEKAKRLYDQSIQRDVPRKGDDSLLALVLTAYPEISTASLSPFYNLIDFMKGSLNPVPSDEDAIVRCKVYHCVSYKPWFVPNEPPDYAHKYFVNKWIEVMINNLTQEEIKRWYPKLYKSDVIQSDDVSFYWFSAAPSNFGDWITPYYVKKVCGRELRKPVDPTTTSKRVIVSTGSIMRLCGENTIVWGSGIRDRKQDIRPGLDVRSVRGPLTRDRILEVGGECPPIYGDPALLLPRFYTPCSVEKRYRLGIIPHVSQCDQVKEQYQSMEGATVIDLRTSNIERVVDRVCECEAIVSSSLHGIIVANAYGIPVRWIKFDTNVFGDDTKYYDHFASIGRVDEAFIDALFYKRISMESLLSEIHPYEIEIDLDKLWDAGVFHDGEVSKYVRYLMS